MGNRLTARAVAASRLKNHSITRQQVNLSKLGMVPKAASALSAISAASATNVTGRIRFIKTIPPAGSGFSTANTVTLGTSGPLRIFGACYTIPGTPSKITGGIYLSSTVAGYWNAYDPAGGPVLAANTPIDVGYSDASAAAGTPDFQDPYDGTFAAITGNLDHYITGLVSVGVNLTSANGCTFAGFTSAS